LSNAKYYTESNKVTFNVTGNTFQFKDKIKKAGAKWNGAMKCWTVELFKSDALWAYQDRGLVFNPANNTATATEKAKAYNDLYNEGGEGYVPSF
jgi:hypothetical protein